MSEPTRDDERIAELEIRIAFQDKLCAQLDETVREFATRVEALEAKLERLKGSMDEEPIGPQLDPPPHY